MAFTVCVCVYVWLVTVVTLVRLHLSKIVKVKVEPHSLFRTEVLLHKKALNLFLRKEKRKRRKWGGRCEYERG